MKIHGTESHGPKQKGSWHSPRRPEIENVPRELLTLEPANRSVRAEGLLIPRLGRRRAGATRAISPGHLRQDLAPWMSSIASSSKQRTIHDTTPHSTFGEADIACDGRVRRTRACHRAPCGAHLLGLLRSEDLPHEEVHLQGPRTCSDFNDIQT